MKIGIIGLGLIGGSLAMAAKKQGHAIYAYDQSPDAFHSASAQQAIDSKCDSIADLARCASLIVLCVPSGEYDNVLAQLAPALTDHHVITDCGSVKASAIAVAKTHLLNRYGQFVPAHPIAGKETSGCENASNNLFINKKIILCCDEQTQPAAQQLVQQLWESVGGKVINMSPAAHDEIFSTVSHLPHVLAYAMVNLIDQNPKRDGLVQYSAGGFRDFTRIAGSHPAMWRDISVDNKQHLLAAIDNFQTVLAAIAQEIASDNKDALYNRFASARQLRKQWMEVIDR